MERSDLRGRLTAYVSRCEDIFSAVNANDSNVRLFYPPRRLPGVIAKHAEKLSEFPVGPPSELFGLHDQATVCENENLEFRITPYECRAFLRNVGLYHNVAKGVKIDVQTLTESLVNAVEEFGYAFTKRDGRPLVADPNVEFSPRYDTNSGVLGLPQNANLSAGWMLMAVEGLEIPEGGLSLSDTSGIFKPPAQELAALLAVDVTDAFSEEANRSKIADRLQGCALVQHSLPTAWEVWGVHTPWSLLSSTGNPEEGLMPSIHLLPSLEQGIPRPVARFVHWKSPLIYPPVYLHEEDEFNLQKEIRPIQTTGLSLTGRTQERFFQVHERRFKASKNTNRIERAIRYFSRASNELSSIDEMEIIVDPTPRRAASIERIFLDLMIALEKLFMDNVDRGPKGIISRRLASLLAVDDKRRQEVSKRVCDLYTLRNLLVHGDAPPRLVDVLEATFQLHQWVRVSILGILSLTDNVIKKVQQGVDKPAIREQNRKAVARVLLENEQEFINRSDAKC